MQIVRVSKWMVVVDTDDIEEAADIAARSPAGHTQSTHYAIALLTDLSDKRSETMNELFGRIK